MAEPVVGADFVDPLLYVEDTFSRPTSLDADAIEKINAGANLVAAFYYGDGRGEILMALPKPIIAAVARAQAAYGVGRG